MTDVLGSRSENITLNLYVKICVLQFLSLQKQRVPSKWLFLSNIIIFKLWKSYSFFPSIQRLNFLIYVELI